MSVDSSSTTSRPLTIGVIIGSARKNGNHIGLFEFVKNRFCHVQSASESASESSNDHLIASSQLILLSPSSPLGPVIDDIMPAMYDGKGEPSYPSPAVRDWSLQIRSVDGLIFLTPQYNWGLPGELKNSLDHLYHEWKGLPTGIITYGGHGGVKCATQLRQITEGGLKMKVLSVENDVAITLPREFISGEERITTSSLTSSSPPEFLKPYEIKIDTMIQQLLSEAVNRKALPAASSS